MKNALYAFIFAAATFLAFTIVSLTAVNQKSDADSMSLNESVSTSPSMTTFASVVRASGLNSLLAGDQEFTLFVPSNEAFAKLPVGMLHDLLKPENRDKLKSIVSYHIIPGKYSSKQLFTTVLPTLSGKSVEIRVDKGTITVDRAKVIKQDIHTKNGIIYITDSVMFPQ